MSRFVKLYIIFVTVLLLGACGAGLYVWYTLQNINTQVHDVNARIPVSRSDTVEEVPQNEVVATSTTEQNSVAKDALQTAPATEKVYRVSDLTESQQAILKTFGYTSDTFTITDAMIACAEDAVGNTRLGEILGGSAPSPLESMKLLPCFKK